MNQVLLRPMRAAAVAATAGLAALAGIGAATAGAAEPWGFEQVTPPVKDGGAISGSDTFQTSPDGESFLYTASTAFGTVPAESAPMYIRYLGTRGPESWANRPVDVPYGSEQSHFMWSVLGTSKNLEYALVVSTVALTPDATSGGTNWYLRTTRTGALRLLATRPNPLLVALGPMAGLAHEFIADDGKSALFKAALGPNGESSLYSWTEEGVSSPRCSPRARRAARWSGCTAVNDERDRGAGPDSRTATGWRTSTSRHLPELPLRAHGRPDDSRLVLAHPG